MARVISDAEWIEAAIAGGAEFRSGPRARRTYRPVASRTKIVHRPWGADEILVANCEGSSTRPERGLTDTPRISPAIAVEKSVAELRRMKLVAGSTLTASVQHAPESFSSPAPARRVTRRHAASSPAGREFLAQLDALIAYADTTPFPGHVKAGRALKQVRQQSALSQSAPAPDPRAEHAACEWCHGDEDLCDGSECQK